MKYQLRKKSEMKDSGVDWIGGIPKDWEATPLKRWVNFQGGHGFSEDLQGRTTGEYPFMKVSDINSGDKYVKTAKNYVSKQDAASNGWRVVPKGSILLGKIGAALLKNHRKITLSQSYIDNNLLAINPKNHVDSEFMFWVSKSIDAADVQNISTIPSINMNMLKSYIVAIPPKQEQKKIADFLDQQTKLIDEIVLKKKKQIELLKEKRSALINQAVTKGLAPKVKMKDSGTEWIGDVPEGWDIVALNRLLDRNDGGVWGEDGVEGDQIVLRSTDIKQDGQLIITDPATRRLSETEKKKGRLLPGDLLITKSSGSAKHLGKTAIAPDQFENEVYYYSNFMQRLRLDSENEPRYFYYLMNNGIGKQQINYWGSTTSGLVNLNGSLIGRFVFPNPPKSEQESIADFLDKKTEAINGVIKKTHNSIKLIQKYRSSLISHTVTGKIKVQ